MLGFVFRGKALSSAEPSGFLVILSERRAALVPSEVRTRRHFTGYLFHSNENESLPF